MRTSDIAYVKQGSYSQKPTVPLEEMSLKEITKTYLTTCVQSNGLVSACMKCKKKCIYGEKAIELATGFMTPEAKQASYEGSMLQYARMQNGLNRTKQALSIALENEKKEVETKIQQVQEEIKEAEEQIKTEKRRRKVKDSWQEWFEESLKSGNQVQWVMDKFGLDKRTAQRKIYQARYRNEGVQELVEKYRKVKKEEEKKEEEKKELPETKEVVEETNDNSISKAMELKLEKLMNKQEECEAEIKRYQEEFEQKIKEPKEKLAKLKEQIDIICKTMDIFNEI